MLGEELASFFVLLFGELVALRGADVEATKEGLDIPQTAAGEPLGAQEAHRILSPHLGDDSDFKVIGSLIINPLTFNAEVRKAVNEVMREHGDQNEVEGNQVGSGEIWISASITDMNTIT